MAVEDNSPSFEAGLRPGDLITHINGEPIQGLLHHQVLQLILSGGDRIHIRTIPLDSTTIKTGGRKRNPSSIKMAKRPLAARRRTGQAKRDGHSDKKRRASLLRRLSNKRASAEIHQTVTGSSPVLTPSRSFQSLTRTLTSGDSLPASPTRLKSPRSPPTTRFCTQSDSPHSTGNSSQSSSPSSSVPNSPASSTHLPHFPRPSSLHGLKHKLTQTFHSPRRKSVGHIPLSPLARTPSPSPIASTSPTRSPSPLAFPIAHHTPGCQALKVAPVSPLSATICSSAKKAFMRPKSAEPSSPLLRRALSPDRLHPKSAEAKAKRESFSGQASPLVLSSSPSSTRSYLSSASTSKLCLSSPRSSFSTHMSSISSKSLVDFYDGTTRDTSPLCSTSTAITPRFKSESRTSQPWHSISQLRRKGDRAAKTLVFTSGEGESRAGSAFGAVQKTVLSTHDKGISFTPDIEITSCANTIKTDTLPSATASFSNKEIIRIRSESEPIPMSHIEEVMKNAQENISECQISECCMIDDEDSDRETYNTIKMRPSVSSSSGTCQKKSELVEKKKNSADSLKMQEKDCREVVAKDSAQKDKEVRDFLGASGMESRDAGLMNVKPIKMSKSSESVTIKLPECTDGNETLHADSKSLENIEKALNDSGKIKSEDRTEFLPLGKHSGASISVFVDKEIPSEKKNKEKEVAPDTSGIPVSPTESGISESAKLKTIERSSKKSAEQTKVEIVESATAKGTDTTRSKSVEPSATGKSVEQKKSRSAELANAKSSEQSRSKMVEQPKSKLIEKSKIGSPKSSRSPECSRKTYPLQTGSLKKKIYENPRSPSQAQVKDSPLDSAPKKLMASAKTSVEDAAKIEPKPTATVDHHSEKKVQDKTPDSQPETQQTTITKFNTLPKAKNQAPPPPACKK